MDSAQFAGALDITKGHMIAAGPTNSVVIDRRGMYWMAGKFRTTGDGSDGAPYSTFKYIPDIM